MEGSGSESGIGYSDHTETTRLGDRDECCKRRESARLRGFGTNGKVDPDTGEAFGNGETTFTFTAQLTLTHGTRISFHQVGHVVFDATGVVKLEFFKEKA